MNYLDTIVAHKREEVNDKKRRQKRSALSEMEYFARPRLPFRSALLSKNPFAIIAEIKRSSPSAGLLNNSIDPQSIAAEYESNGAAAISVLTDTRFFKGTHDDLRIVRQSTCLPLLCKEFIIDDYQITEAAAYGADAVLLIAAILERSQLMELYSAATEQKLECLVELYDAPEIDKLDFDTIKLVGINNRNLKTFEVNIGNTLSLAYRIPKDVTIVSESGVSSSGDLKKLAVAGIHAALVGEHLMKSARPGKALRSLLDGFKQ